MGTAGQMNLLWQDGVGSFLDSAMTDAGDSSISLSSGDGGAPWFAETDSLLWGGAGAAVGNGDANVIAGGGFSPNGAPDNSLLGGGLLCGEPSTNTSLWPVNDPWAIQNNAPAQNTFSGPTGTGAMSPLWQALVPAIEQVSTELHLSFVDSLLNGAVDLLWTATGGTGQPPVTLPITGNPLTGSLPGVGGFPGSAFSTLAPQQLVWTDSSQGVAATFTQQSNASVIPVNLNPLFGRS